MAKFITQCMFCSKEHSSIDRPDLSKDQISHGLCRPLCDEAREAGWGEFVDKPEPKVQVARICPDCKEAPVFDKPVCRNCERSDLFETTMAGSIILALSLALSLLLLATLASCAGSEVTEPLLDSIAWRESRNNPRAVGRAGELGAYQLKSIAVRDVNRIYGTRYKHRDAVARGREIARAFLFIQERRLTRSLGRQPTAVELYDAYRYGFRGFMKGQR